MDIGKAFENGWKLFVKDVAPLVVGALIVLVLSIVSLGILAGPLWGGLYRMIVMRVRDGRPADFGDVFSAFDRFWTLFAAAVVVGILVAFGLLLLILPGLLLAAIWLYVPLFIVDRGMSLGDAMRASRELVARSGLWEHVVVVLLIAVITFLVGTVVGIGFLLTWPLTVTVVAALYFSLSGDPGLLAAAVGDGGAATVAQAARSAGATPPPPAGGETPGEGRMPGDPASGESPGAPLPAEMPGAATPWRQSPRSPADPPPDAPTAPGDPEGV